MLLKMLILLVFLVGHDEFKQLQLNKEKVVLDFCGVKKNNS